MNCMLNAHFEVYSSLLTGGFGVFLLRKTPENAEFAIAGAISDARKNRPGRVTKRGGGGGGARDRRS